jgi:hypothetical protein
MDYFYAVCLLALRASMFIGSLLFSTQSKPDFYTREISLNFT